MTLQARLQLISINDFARQRTPDFHLGSAAALARFARQCP
jgi:hypothetical protein